ncbi:MAG: 2-isopropylmalate synthase [Oscillospiraceae bacterium]|nr:2-isopropylmalate synthase [Ruminococcus sp.]MBQ7002526.1 2-isopropylmalate synthase [Oscillospiraceae bacterium]MBQ7013605.1 2-isopropylmalate synthase [Oscillospiraceae bacterium]
MKNYEKYTRQYFDVENPPMRWTQKTYIDKAPIWCSVDLRDGNQALIIPMSLEEKLEFFTFLVQVGFKEIEIGFPAASDTEYEFCRALIEKNLIPDDVTIQVLTQSREHIIAKTFEALKGCKNAIVHLYNSTSLAQREQVFKREKKEIIDIAIFGAKLCKEYREKTPGNFRFEYSPESFTGTEPEFAAEICNAVIDIWQPTPEDKVIINLPVTVSHSMPHIYANQVEYMCDHLNNRENLIISLHPHNDRGCAVADSEMGLLAGADRIEGTLFGNGERTGNVDIVTLGMNMFSQGVDPELDFSDLPKITEVYERVTRMHVYERQPYSGQLVFAAFSGSHQDAIAKGMHWREEKNCEHWTVPYLPIDPTDVGRVYEADVIRINSQSGKGGIGYLLETQFGLDLPKAMREEFGYIVKGVSDRGHRELQPAEVHDIFRETYVNIASPLEYKETHYVQKDGIQALVTCAMNGEEQTVHASGNGRLDAVSNAVKKFLNLDYTIKTYTEHALTVSSKSDAVSYVGIEMADGKVYWGVGQKQDISDSSVYALFSALNRYFAANEK